MKNIVILFLVVLLGVILFNQKVCPKAGPFRLDVQKAIDSGGLKIDFEPNAGIK